MTTDGSNKENKLFELKEEFKLLLEDWGVASKRFERVSELVSELSRGE